MPMTVPPAAVDPARVVLVVNTPCPPELRPSNAWSIVPFLVAHGHSFPIRKKIAEHFGCTPETVTHWLDALIGLGVVRRNGKQLALDETRLDSYLEKSGIRPWGNSEFFDLPTAASPLTTTTTTTTTTPRARAERTSTFALRSPSPQLFVQEVVEVLTNHEIRARVEINGPAILELRRRGMTLELACAAAEVTFSANKRTVRYWGGVVDRKLEQRLYADGLDRGQPVLRVVSP